MSINDIAAPQPEKLIANVINNGCFKSSVRLGVLGRAVCVYDLGCATIFRRKYSGSVNKHRKTIDSPSVSSRQLTHPFNQTHNGESTINPIAVPLVVRAYTSFGGIWLQTDRSSCLLARTLVTPWHKQPAHCSQTKSRRSFALALVPERPVPQSGFSR